MYPDKDQYEESKLIALLAEDSEYAFQLLFDRHRNRIYQTGIRYLKSPMLAQEVVQDVFMKLWFKRRDIRTDQPLEAWLYTVARNNILNRLKKIAGEWKLLKEYPATGYEENNFEEREQSALFRQLLAEAVRALPEQQRKVFLLARRESLTYVQIGERLGVSPLTVKTHMSRALDSIRTYFAGHGERFLTVLITAGVLFS